ncbi:MAG: universal stress protein [Phycisphaerales bacterium]|nr:universal stress protein [Phycisphaerales bacterium]
MTATISSILLPTRFSVLSRRAAEYVRVLAPRLDARVHIVNVVPHTELIVDPGMAGVSMPVFGPSERELVERAQDKLAAFASEVLPDLAARITVCALFGGVRDGLVKYAADNAVDLVVMGTHADGMLKRAIFGSVGKSVLEHSPCPVLLVPVHGAPR